VTPISRSFVKGRTYFFWQRRLPISHSFLPATVFELRPFLRFMAASASRIAPDTHQDQAAARPGPAPWRHSRPRRTLVPLPHPKEFAADAAMMITRILDGATAYFR
jgi:hypothetical protein